MEYKRLHNKLEEIGAYVRDTYKDKLKAGGVYATGKLYNSVGYNLKVTETGLSLYFEAEDYYINIEEGRKPNSKMPPVEQIRKWMISRGVPDKPGLAFVIARSIGTKGTKPKPYLRETLANIDVYKPELREAIEADIKEEMELRLKNKIKNELKN